MKEEKLEKKTKKELIEIIEDYERKMLKDRLIKNVSIIITIILTIMVISTHIVPIFFHSNVVVALGGEDIERKSDTTGEWEIMLRNSGLFPSKNVILRVRFDKYVEIDYDNMFCNPTPDNKKIEGENEIEYAWNNLDSGRDNIHLRISVSSPFSLMGKTGAFVEVRAEGEGLTYNYYG